MNSKYMLPIKRKRWKLSTFKYKLILPSSNIPFQVSSLFKEVGVSNLAVQVEKPSYFQHMSGLGISMDQVYEMARNFKTLNQEYTTDFLKTI